MWSKLDKEISSVKDQINTQTNNNITSLKDLINEYKEIVIPSGPGLLTYVHQQTKSLYPINFTGISLIANKKIGEYGVYNCNVNLDPTGTEYYCPFNTYLNREQRRYYDQMNQAGFSSIVFKQDLNNELKLSVCGYIQHVKNGTAECIFDYFGNKFTSSLSMAYSDASKAELVMQHLHEINDKISIGGEIAVDTLNGKTLDSKRVALVGRYVDKSIDGCCSATVGLQGMQICLFKKLNPQLKVGSTLDICYQKRKLTGSVGCELSDKEFTLKSSIDTNGCLIANLIKNHFYKNGNIVFKPTISLMCNIQKQVKLGVGFELIV